MSRPMVDPDRPRRLQTALLATVIVTLLFAGCFSTARDQTEPDDQDGTGLGGAATGAGSGGGGGSDNETSGGSGDDPAGDNGTKDNETGDEDDPATEDPPEPVQIDEQGETELMFEETFDWEVAAGWSLIRINYTFEPLTDGGPLVYSRVTASIMANDAAVCHVSTETEVTNSPVEVLHLEIHPEAAACGHADASLEVDVTRIVPGEWSFTASGLAQTGWSFVATVEY